MARLVMLMAATKPDVLRVGTSEWTTSNSINAVAGVQDGDLLLWVQAGRNSSQAVTLSGSWTTARADASSQPTFGVYYRFASGEPSSYTTSTNKPSQVQGYLVAYRNVSSIDVIGALSALTASNATSVVAPSITATQAGALILLAGSKSVAVGGYTSGPGDMSTFINDGGDGSILVAELIPSATGSTGTKTVTIPSGANNQSYAFLIQLAK